MDTIYFDSALSDDRRRELIYEGQLFVFPPRAASIALCQFARTMIQDAFAGRDPLLAQFELSTQEYVRVLAQLKPRFVHAPESTQLVQALLANLGCDLDKTYIDVPRLKSIPHGGDHRSGLTFAIHPHRDTWYSAPLCQMNWWIPVYDMDAASALAFHLSYWNRPVRNGSSRFNHYRWNKSGRKVAATELDRYIEEQPRPEEPIDLSHQVRPITPAGGVFLFSAAQLHSAVPNTSGRTRFSIDFRTLHIADAAARRGAPNVDAAATGTTLRDFRRGTDLSPVPAEIVSIYDDEIVHDGELVFEPPKL